MTDELIDLYCEESTLPRNVIAAFVSADLEPPTAERVDQHGYTPAERELIRKHYRDTDPYGEWSAKDD